MIPDSVWLTTNAEVNEISGCTRIAGELAIEGTLISDLRPLFALERVDGDLHIMTLASETNPDANDGVAQLTTLDGLGALAHIGGTLGITQNPRLVDTSALRGLVVTEQYLMISGNAALASLTGLRG